MKATFYSEFMLAARAAPRLYFAPLIGAGRAIREEFRRVQEDASAKPAQAPAAKH